jgi:hypothetical protein
VTEDAGLDPALRASLGLPSSQPDSGQDESDHALPDPSIASPDHVRDSYTFTNPLREAVLNSSDARAVFIPFSTGSGKTAAALRFLHSLATADEQPRLIRRLIDRDGRNSGLAPDGLDAITKAFLTAALETPAHCESASEPIPTACLSGPCRDLPHRPIGPTSRALCHAPKVGDSPAHLYMTASGSRSTGTVPAPAAPTAKALYLESIATTDRRPMKLKDTLCLLSMVMIALLRAAQLRSGHLPPAHVSTAPDLLVRASSRNLRGPDLNALVNGWPCGSSG